MKAMGCSPKWRHLNGAERANMETPIPEAVYRCTSGHTVFICFTIDELTH